jgi:hypothetical protein
VPWGCFRMESAANPRCSLIADRVSFGSITLTLRITLLGLTSLKALNRETRPSKALASKDPLTRQSAD